MATDQKLNIIFEENGKTDKDLTKSILLIQSESNSSNESSCLASITNRFTFIIKHGREIYIGLVFFFLYSGFAIFLPTIPTLFHQLGFTPAELVVSGALMPIFSGLARVISCALADITKTHKPIMVATMILSSFIVPLALLLPPIREPCPAAGSASAATSNPVSAADTNSSSAPPPPPLAACDGSLFEVTPTFVAGTAIKVVTASLFPVAFPIYEGAVMLYLRTTHRENYYGLFRVPGTVGQMVVSVLNGIALDKAVDPVSKRVRYWPAFAILFVLLNITALLLYLYRLPRAMRPPRSLCARLRARCCARSALSTAQTNSGALAHDQRVAFTASPPAIVSDSDSDERGSVNKRMCAPAFSKQATCAGHSAGEQELCGDVGEVSNPHQFMQAMKFAFTNTRVSVFLFFSFCTGLIYGGWDGFTFFYLKENGASELNVSMLFFSMVTFEVFGMAIFSTLMLRFLPPEALVMISFFFEIIHMAVYALIKLLQISCWFSLLNEVLQSLTFALIVPAGATFMERNSPSPKVSATMQAIFSLATFGLGMCVGALVFGFVYSHHGPVAMYLSSSCLAAVCFVSYTALYLLVPALHAPQPTLESESNAKLAAADATAAAATGAAVEPESDALNHLSHSFAADAAAAGAGECVDTGERDEVADDAEQVVMVVVVPHSETAQSFASVDSDAPLLHSSPARRPEPERKQPLSDIPEHSVPAHSPRLPHTARPNSEHSAQQASLRERMANARSRFFLS